MGSVSSDFLLLEFTFTEYKRCVSINIQINCYHMGKQVTDFNESTKLSYHQN